ncbi:MAG: hypothetical protein ERJ67_11260, partial [Aphanocapsa feldmannii 277cV]
MDMIGRIFQPRTLPRNDGKGSEWPTRCQVDTGGRVIAMGAGRRLNIVGAVLAAAALLLAPLRPAHACTVISVANTGQGLSPAAADLNNGAVAQAFTTGSDSGGYTLRYVSVRLKDAPGNGSLDLELWSIDGDRPGEWLVDFRYIEDIRHGGFQPIGEGIQIFRTPSLDGRNLDPDTTYFVVMRYPGGGNESPTWRQTNSNDEDSNGQTGWSIADQYFQYSDSGSYSQSKWGDAVSGSLILQIHESWNSAPKAASSTLSTNENTALTFNQQSFNFSDNDNTNFQLGNFKTLESVKIVSLPDANQGTLYLEGKAIAITSSDPDKAVEVTKAQLDNDQFTYIPPDDAHGNDFTTFRFRVNDGCDNSFPSNEMTIDVEPVNDPPSLSGPTAIEYVENSTAVVAIYTATDLEGDPITWSLEGNDRDDFSIDNDTGELRFDVQAFPNGPDYDSPADANGDNIYAVTVVASDGNSLNATGKRDVTVRVTDRSVSGPTAIDYTENDTAAVATYTVTNPDNAVISWNLSGADSNAFRIRNDGTLSFKLPPNYEVPADANTDNIYEVMVMASINGSTDTTLDVEVMVINGNDAPVAADDTATTPARTGQRVVVHVLDNDSDEDGDRLIVSEDTAPNYGSTQWSDTDGRTTIIYRLGDNFAGQDTDTFTYSVSDGTKTDTATVTVTLVSDEKNANLSALSLRDGIEQVNLDPTVFSADRTNYSTTVANDVTSLSLFTTTQADDDSDDNSQEDPIVTVKVNNDDVTKDSDSDSFPIDLNVGNNTITVSVTADDGTTMKTYTIDVTRAASTNAALLTLSLDGTKPVDLNPAFSADTTEYTATVENETESLSLSPTTEHDNATIEVQVNNDAVTRNSDSSFPIPLNVGNNTITVSVTAEDDTTTRTYTINVTRAASTNAALLALSLDGTKPVDLDPAFSADTTEYTATVANDVESLSLSPTTEHDNATIEVQVNNEAVTRDSDSD